jgi:two-component system NtrC family sensor kinase
MKLSLATRIFLGYAAVLVTFGAVSLFSVAEMHQNQQEIRLVSQGYLHLSQEAASIETFHKNESRDLARVLDEKSPETRRALIRLAKLYFPPLIAQHLASAREKTNEMLEVAPASEHPFLHELAARLTEMDERHHATDVALDGLLAELSRSSPDPAAISRRRAELDAATGGLEGDVRYLHGALENRIRERVEKAEQRERRTGVAIIALSVLAIAVGLIATALSARSLRPVRTLTSFVSRIARGDYSAEVSVKGDDEIATLAREFDQMARALREREAQLKEKQAALLRAEQLAAVGRISAQIAHEVRNPLSSIGLNVELIDEAFAKARFSSEAEAKEARDVLASVLREVDRVTEITESYLKMARLPQPALAKEDVNRVVANVLDFSREELERARVQVVRELDPGLPDTLADEGQLRQVFLNLVRNSRDAMREGGTLTVRTGARDGELEIEFRDSGEGIRAEVKAQVFEPFFSTKQGGTGLGLAVSRQIVQAHGGTIGCESVDGGGTSFVIRLPRA